MNRSFLSVFSFLMLFLLALTSCNFSPRPYKTKADKVQLLEMKNKVICIISFSADQHLYTTGGSAGAAYKDDRGVQLIDALVSSQFQKMRDVFSSHFRLAMPSNYIEVKTRIQPTQTQLITSIIEKAKADFGLIIFSRFGWEWAPVKSGVSHYSFQTFVMIVNRQGVPVWEFAGKGLFNTPIMKFDKKEIESFVSGVFGQAPSIETIVSYYEDIFLGYSKLTLTLIEEDILGKIHGSHAEEYLKDTRLFLVNADEQRWLTQFPTSPGSE